MREQLRLANVVTSVSLTAGFLALLVAPARVALAVVLVVLAAALDGVDGALARRAGGDHTFGAQLDSLADLLCFCVVPAFTVSYVVLADSRIVGVLAGCVVVLAGGWRLARFPLVRAQGHFVGLPTPAAGCLLMLLALWAPTAVVVLGAAVLSALMVSTLHVPTLPTAAARVRPGRRAHALRRRLPRRRPAAMLRPARTPARGQRGHPRTGDRQHVGRARRLLPVLRGRVHRRRGRP